MATGFTEYELAIAELKKALKKQRVTYRQLAQGIGLSESGVKKILAASDGSFQRLAQICKYAGISMAELLDGTSDSILDVSYSEKQQQYLLTHPNAFRLYWTLVYERVPLAEAERSLKLSAKESFALLHKLDQLKLLMLLPEGRVRIPPVRQIRWVGDGPLVRKLYKEWSLKFVESVARPGEEPHRLFLIRYFKVTPRTLKDLITAQKTLEEEFVRRATQEMRSEASDLVHLRWLSAVDDKSFLA